MTKYRRPIGDELSSDWLTGEVALSSELVMSLARLESIPRIAISLPLGRIWRGRAIGIDVETRGSLLEVFVITPLPFNHDDMEMNYG